MQFQGQLNFAKLFLGQLKLQYQQSVAFLLVGKKLLY